MRKLSLAAVLPALHLLTSAVVVGWRFLPLADPSRSVTLWFALNGPVLVLIDLAKLIFTLAWVSPHVSPVLTGQRAIYFIFLVGGLALWFFVGRLVDNFLRRKSLIHTPQHRLISLILIGWGVRLAFDSMEWILPRYPGQRHSSAHLTSGVIILIWSLLLIFLPAIKFATRRVART